MSEQYSPKRVLHLNTEQSWRGGERQTLWLADRLRNHGSESEVAAWPGSPLDQRARALGLTVHAVRPLVPVDPFAALALGRLLRRGNFDVLHAHTGHALTLGLLAARPKGTALVGSKRVDRPAHAGSFTRWKYRHTDGLIAVSRHVREVLLAAGAPAHKVEVVHDGVDTARVMTPASPETLRQLGVTGRGPLVVMVAALVPTKAPEMFVRAIAEARRLGVPCEGLLVGDGELRPMVERERARLGLENVLHLTGWRDDADSFIAAADVVALTSRGEGQGSVLLDAMVCAKPVVATRAGGIPDVVDHEISGLLAPVDDAAAIGAAIARLCADEPLRRRMGDHARHTRVGAFSLDRCASLTRDAYCKALQRRRGDPRADFPD